MATTTQPAIFEESILDNFIGNAIITRRDKMIYGKIENGIIIDHQKNDVTHSWNTYLIEARFYNDEQELKVFMRMNKLFYRIRNKTNDNEYSLSSQQILLGTSFEEKNGFIIATEERGTCIYIPKDAIENLNSITTEKLTENKNRIALNTIDYVDFENNLATIVDTRFVNYKII